MLCNRKAFLSLATPIAALPAQQQKIKDSIYDLILIVLLLLSLNLSFDLRRTSKCISFCFISLMAISRISPRIMPPSKMYLVVRVVTMLDTYHGHARNRSVSNRARHSPKRKNQQKRSKMRVIFWWTAWFRRRIQWIPCNFGWQTHAPMNWTYQKAIRVK